MYKSIVAINYLTWVWLRLGLTDQGSETTVKFHQFLTVWAISNYGLILDSLYEKKIGDDLVFNSALSIESL